LVKDYNTIGFNADNSILRFKSDEVVKLGVNVIINDLNRNFKGYEFLDEIDFDKNLGTFSKGVVWDIYNGLILKLGENKQIIGALFGY
jgi:hypothetical protein